MTTPILETSRLILRELQIEDTIGMFLLDSNPEVHRFLGQDPIKSVEESKKTIEFVQYQYKEFGIGRWAVIDKENNVFLGWCGLKYNVQTINGISNYYDLGYRFRKEFWGKGIAFESALACIKYGLDKLQLQVIHAAAHPQNIASVKILEKIGFKNSGNFTYKEETHKWFTITPSDFV